MLIWRQVVYGNTRPDDFDDPMANAWEQQKIPICHFSQPAKAL